MKKSFNNCYGPLIIHLTGVNPYNGPGACRGAKNLSG